MKTLLVLSALFAACCARAIIEDPETKVVYVTDDFYIENFVVYKGKGEITKIVVPINEINISEHTDIDDFDLYVFFIEAGKGLYVLKDGVATLLLANGRDIGASGIDGSNQVFFGASDGIYTFNAEKKTAEKFGTLTDNIKGLLVANGTHEIYILTEENVFYQVNADGTSKQEIPEVKNAQQVALDSYNNIYYVDNENTIHVRSYADGSVKKVSGIPENSESFSLVRAPPLIEGIVPVIIDDRAYLLFADGHSKDSKIVLSLKPTAYAPESTLVVYIAHDKKIYQYKFTNGDEIGQSENFNEVSSYVNEKVPNLKQTINKKFHHV